MGSLISYSGISTKIRAMERWRITDRQFKEMESLESVSEAVAFLRRFPPYQEILSGAEDEGLHRGSIEKHLNLSQYRDFAKLYKFANIKQRRFLDLYFVHYEISIIKTCLRNAAGNREQSQDLSQFKDFFERHASIDLIRLSESRGIGEFIENLKGSPYYGPLYSLLEKGKATMPACENALDMLYFRGIWKVKDKFLTKSESEIITQCFGTRMDMLNIQWICRAKKYYRLSPSEIIALIIPINLHLSREEIRKLAEAETMEQLTELIRQSWYGRLDLEMLSANGTKEGKGLSLLEQLAREIVDRIYLKTSQKDPYSIAVLNSYLYFKERETQRIINTIEKIRYGVAIQ